jgi:hypothetical protein
MTNFIELDIFKLLSYSYQITLRTSFVESSPLPSSTPSQADSSFADLPSDSSSQILVQEKASFQEFPHSTAYTFPSISHLSSSG